MVNEMSLRLEKLVEDIKEETILWPIEDAKNSPEEDAAWARIGAKHKMTGPHVKSIFKVLSKKYEVEKANPNTEWKLFSYLSFLDIKKEENIDNNTDGEIDDNEEFVELLEVNDDYCSDDEEPNTSGGSFSESTSKNATKQQQPPQIPPEIQIRKLKNDKYNDKFVSSEKKDTKNGTIRKIGQNSLSESFARTTTSAIGSQVKSHDQMLRKSSSPSSIVVRIPMTASKTVSNQEKKIQSTITSGLKLKVKKDEKLKETLPNLKEIKLKRKIDNMRAEKNEDDPPVKRQIVLPKGIRVIPPNSKSSVSSKIILSASNELQSQNASNESTNSNFMPISPTDKLPPFSSLLKKSPTLLTKDQEKLSQQMKIQNQKQDHEELEIKTEISPRTSTSSISNITLTNNKMNGIDAARKDFSEKSEATLEIEQISKDADENTEIKVKVLTEQAEKILPTFFRDLYNSKKYDSFGMYVSSTMNRLPLHLASKLEAKILQSIIEINAMAVNEHIENI